DVPVVAAGHPDRAGEPLLDLPVEGLLNLGPHRHPATPQRQCVDRIEDVGQLALEYRDDRAGPQVRVGAVHDEEVRESGHGHAQIGLCTATPGLVQLPAVAAANLHRGEEAGALETGGEHDDVRWADRSVLGDHAVLGQLTHATGEQRDVGSHEGGEIFR